MTLANDISRGPASNDLERQRWDAVIIGTGIGGATIGHALARAGKRVLFFERGRYRRTAGNATLGRYPEESRSDARPPSGNDLLRAGRCDFEITDTSKRNERRFVPFIGCGVGGSSALYGMALERLFPIDFTPRVAHPDASGTSLEEEWPISYAALEPYYTAAESLYRVRGGVDASRPLDDQPRHLLPPPPLSNIGVDVSEFLRTRGMHPYRLPQACEFVVGCNGCQGFLCEFACKNDAERVCLTAALRDHGASLLDECEVLRIEAGARRAEHVVCARAGRQFHVSADTIIVAAGALQTPKLLLGSHNEYWPNGLANRSGRVGRNLMRHLIDLYCVEPIASAMALDNRFKEVAFNDFYHCADGKFGSVQSFGRLPPAHVLFSSMRDDLRHGPLHWLAPALSVGRGLVMPTLRKMVEGRIVLASIVEDLPQMDNRVVPGAHPGSIRIEYRLTTRERARIVHMRRLLAEVLGPRRPRLIKQAENNQRIAHACGTCRFGTDPATSVLDRNNKAHDLDNLFVVDSSFFPTSGGTNPGLTIAANALRVADRILAAT